MFGFVQQFSPSVVYGSVGVFIIVEIILFIAVIVLLVQNSRIKKKLTIFFSGKDAKDLEGILTKQLDESKELDREIQELFEISNRLHELGQKSVHKLSVLRFNPFKEVGGNQSFSVALLDGKNSGVIISSLHTREGTRVYAKPIVNGGADGFPLTEEEKTAIAKAISGKPLTV